MQRVTYVEVLEFSDMSLKPRGLCRYRVETVRQLGVQRRAGRTGSGCWRGSRRRGRRYADRVGPVARIDPSPCNDMRRWVGHYRRRTRWDEDNGDVYKQRKHETGTVTTCQSQQVNDSIQVTSKHTYRRSTLKLIHHCSYYYERPFMLCSAGASFGIIAADTAAFLFWRSARQKCSYLFRRFGKQLVS